jgi:hypothetical protein
VSRSAAPRLGLTGRCIFRDTIRTRDWPGLCARVEGAIRAVYADEGFVVRVDERLGSWFLRAKRGFTSGFAVGLIRRPGPSGSADVMVMVSRTSRLDSLGTGTAIACALGTLVAGCLFIGALGLPALVAGAAVIAATVFVAVSVYQLLLPTVSLAEYLGGGRFTREQIVAVVERVRGACASPAESVAVPE